MNIRNESSKEWELNLEAHFPASWAPPLGKAFDFRCKCLCSIVQNATQPALLQYKKNMDGHFCNVGSGIVNLLWEEDNKNKKPYFRHK